jgi:hypothetical protein
MSVDSNLSPDVDLSLSYILPVLTFWSLSQAPILYTISLNGPNLILVAKAVCIMSGKTS